LTAQSSIQVGYWMSLVKPRAPHPHCPPHKREGWVGKLNRNSIPCRRPRVPLIDGSIMVCSTPSHVLIVCTAAAIRRHPVNVLIWVLDVASLAVDAILRVDDVRQNAALLYPFINLGGTVARGGASIDVVLGRPLQCRIRYL